MAETAGKIRRYQSLEIFSYGFRPFFLGASVFAALAVPLWIMILAGDNDIALDLPAREWHVHEMVFGFLPGVMTGFLLTAIPNWTDRPPLRGIPLMLLFALWLAGRLALATPWVHPLLSAIIDGAFLVVVAIIVWREIAVGRAWTRLPIGFLISLYALANIMFHVLFLRSQATDLPERMALAFVMVLLALIGGRITPGFTEAFLADQGMTEQPAPFSRIDGLSIILVVGAAIAWIAYPKTAATGWIFLAAGLINFVRVLRWYGWRTWREPLVLILHLGYSWLVISLLMIGGAILGFGLSELDAVHALTTGAVGVMTLAVMTRASLGHTGRPKQAGIFTILIYLMVNVGAILRVLGPSVGSSKIFMLSMAAICWSGAYMVFVMVYGPMLLRRSLEEE